MNKEDGQTVLAILGLPVAIGLILVALIPLGLFHAWATQKMYIWFLLPLGAPALNLWHVWGISLIINRFTATTDSKNSSIKDSLGGIVKSIFITLLMLLIGYVIKSHI